MQLADTPSSQSATLGLHPVAVATTHFLRVPNFSARRRPGGAGPSNVNLGHSLLSQKLLELES